MKLLIRTATIVGALVIVAPFLVLLDMMGRLLPTPFVVITYCLFGAVALWLFLRRRGAAAAGSESSLFRSSSMSKEGLL